MNWMCVSVQRMEAGPPFDSGAFSSFYWAFILPHISPTSITLLIVPDIKESTSATWELDTIFAKMNIRFDGQHEGAET